jgi:hypothetical protein
MFHSQYFTADTRARLAHFSVKEYLESERILGTKTDQFHLESARHFTAGPELRMGFGAVGLIKLNMKLSRANQMCKA